MRSQGQRRTRRRRRRGRRGNPGAASRWAPWQRARLARETISLPTRYGTLSFKVSRLEGEVVTVTPEFADVRRLALEQNKPVREVLAEAQAEGRRRMLQRV